jgi:hypothetical protein
MENRVSAVPGIEKRGFRGPRAYMENGDSVVPGVRGMENRVCVVPRMREAATVAPAACEAM